MTKSQTSKTSKATPKKAAPNKTTAEKTEAASEKSTDKTTAVEGKPVPAPKDKAATKKKEAATTKPIDIKEAEDDDLRQGDLIRAVAERAAVRNNLARDVVIATLEELGHAVRSNREMKLPGLGRIRYQRVKQNVSSIVTIAKIRQDKDD